MFNSNHHADQPEPLESITTRVIRYEADNVLVILDWTPEDGVSYNVTSIPPAAVILISSYSVQLALHYNTQYNVSILASLCGQSYVTIAVDYDLKFGEFIHAYWLIRF